MLIMFDSPGGKYVMAQNVAFRQISPSIHLGIIISLSKMPISLGPRLLSRWQLECMLLLIVTFSKFKLDGIKSLKPNTLRVTADSRWLLTCELVNHHMGLHPELYKPLLLL